MTEAENVAEDEDAGFQLERERPDAAGGCIMIGLAGALAAAAIVLQIDLGIGLTLLALIPAIPIAAGFVALFGLPLYLIAAHWRRDTALVAMLGGAAVALILQGYTLVSTAIHRVGSPYPDMPPPSDLLNVAAVAAFVASACLGAACGLVFWLGMAATQDRNVPPFLAQLGLDHQRSAWLLSALILIVAFVLSYVL